MSYECVIVAEKPGVARAFAKYLSGGKYRVVKIGRVTAYEFSVNGARWLSIGVSGHLMDFDFPSRYNRWSLVDPRELFFVRPIKVVRPEARKFVKALQEVGRRAKRVILATDADVEGESIAFEIMEIMRHANPNLKFSRAWFSAVTKEDLLGALRRLRELNENLANKAFTRMVLDLTIGAAFTRALTLMVEKRGSKLPRGKFLSYGPCQTPVLYLVVKRALERESFKPEKYYTLEAVLEYDGTRFKATLKQGKIKSRKEAEELLKKAKEAGVAVVSKADYSHVEQKPPVPLNTVELERRASVFLDIRPKQAMCIAEDLYQDGLISYPRTDTTIYPPTLNLRAIASMFRSFEGIGWFVEKYVLSGPIKSRQGSEDDRAHPPIYPTRAAPRAEVVRKHGEKGWKLYELVVRHFIATLSPPAVVEKQKLDLTIGGVEFEARGLKVVEEGYFHVYPYERPQERPLPYMLEGDEAKVVDLKVVARQTKPPDYLTESELLRLMRKYGIGTDATMQDHIHTNIERGYFVVRRKRCIPTPLGKAVALGLLEVVPEIVSPEVRGRMERELQKVAEGLRHPDEVIKDMKSEFLQYYDRLVERGEKLAEKLSEAVSSVFKPRRRRSS